MIWKTKLLGFILLLILVILIISIFLISKLSGDSDINDHKNLIMANYILLFIILFLYMGYLLAIGNFTNGINIQFIILIILILIGLILTLVYLIERNNKDIVNKSFVMGSLSYIITLIIMILIYQIIFVNINSNLKLLCDKFINKNRYKNNILNDNMNMNDNRYNNNNMNVNNNDYYNDNNGNNNNNNMNDYNNME